MRMLSILFSSILSLTHDPIYNETVKLLKLPPKKDWEKRFDNKKNKRNKHYQIKRKRS